MVTAGLAMLVLALAALLMVVYAPTDKEPNEEAVAADRDGSSGILAGIR
jgi:hypothetical protein